MAMGKPKTRNEIGRRTMEQANCSKNPKENSVIFAYLMRNAGLIVRPRCVQNFTIEDFAVEAKLIGRPQLNSICSISSPSCWNGVLSNKLKTTSNCKLSGAKRKAQDEILIPAEKVFGCVLCEVTASSEQALKVHLHGKRHKAKEALLNSNKKNGLPQDELRIPADKVFGCSLCEVSINSEEALKGHLQGKKHKAKEALLNSSKKTGVSIPSEGASGSGSAKKKQQKLWCSLCKVKCNSTIMLEHHLGGKRHRNFMELKRLNNGAKTEAVNTVANEKLGFTENTGVMKEELETAHQSTAP